MLIAIIPRALPWARSFWAFSPYLNHMRNFSQMSLHLDGQKWSLRSLVIKVIKDSPTGSKNRDNNKNINIYIFIIVLKNTPNLKVLNDLND